MKRPDSLHQGDNIYIVAPSFSMSEDRLDAACELIRGCGFEPVVGENASRSCRGYEPELDHYAGTAQQRAAELVEAFRNPDFKAVICTRGGYGALQLLPFLPEGLFGENPKWLVGYSDITTLHSASLAEGVMSIHGNMCSSMVSGIDDPSNASLIDALCGNIPDYQIPVSDYFVPGHAEGILVGGNMISLAALNHSKYDMLSGDDVVLFLEEVGESYHALDRLIRMITTDECFKNVRGIVFGEFEECRRDLPYDSAEQMLFEHVESLGIPVCFGFPAGHGDINMPFIEGAEVSFSVDNYGKSSLKYKDIV